MSDQPSFETFVTAVAEIADVDPARIDAETVLADDLGFDSLGFLQLTVLLTDRYGGDGFPAALDQIEWRQLSVGGVFANYVPAAPPPA